MNGYITILAKELAHRINQVVDLPFLNEEEEKLFFQLVIYKVFELTLGHVYDLLGKDPAE